MFTLKVPVETPIRMRKTLCVKDYFRSIAITLIGNGAVDRNAEPPAADR